MPPDNACCLLIRSELDQAGDIMLSKPWTGPQRKRKKRKFSDKPVAPEGSLPPEYIEHMKAYFEEQYYYFTWLEFLGLGKLIVHTYKLGQIINGESTSLDKDRVKEEHRRVMIANHPNADAGGSHYLASEVNEAKDLMLRKDKSSSSPF
ncbi:hypothetical protein ACH5RR_019436 [Cinchona calisaya]|uniref:Uncharacterized protein n=1 Tax=Cinchona calisaya TaxID=153742 RepID=A0ABD2ZS74_9GENT